MIETAADDGDAPVLKKVISVKISAAVDGDIENWTELHAYNPDHEFWLQSEFIGMTMEEARQLIAARYEQGLVTEMAKNLVIVESPAKDSEAICLAADPDRPNF